MRTIAIPVSGNQFSTHFGGADAFALYSVDDAGTVTAARIVTPPPHERGVFPKWLKQQGVTAVVAGGMGPRASQMLAAYGIDVVLGIASGTPEALVREYVAGRLTSSGSLCEGGHLHECGHHEHDHGA